MTVAEAAKLLEVSDDTVYQLCRAGRLEHRRIGLKRGTIRITPEAIEAFLEGATVEVATQEVTPAEVSGPCFKPRRPAVRNYYREMLAQDEERRASKAKEAT